MKGQEPRLKPGLGVIVMRLSKPEKGKKKKSKKVLTHYASAFLEAVDGKRLGELENMLKHYSMNLAT